MELKNQVISLDIAKRLKELGVKQDSFWYWCDILNMEKGWDWQLLANGGQGREHYSAFTASELGEMLPAGYKITKGHDVFIVEGMPDEPYSIQRATTLADAMGKMLVYLVENNLIKI